MSASINTSPSLQSQMEPPSQLQAEIRIARPRKRRGALALAHLALFAFAIAACDCGPDVAQVRPSLEIESEIVDFGPVAVGITEIRSFSLSAATSATISLSLSLESEEELFYFHREAPEHISGNSTVELVLAFNPRETGIFSGVLDIQSNDPDPKTGNRRILLSGQGQEPEIAVTPESLKLSAVACPNSLQHPSCTSQEIVQIRNVGKVPLMIESVTAKGRDNAALPEGLSLLDPIENSAEDQPIPPGGSLNARIRWQPPEGSQQSTPVHAVLLVNSNAPDQLNIQVPITATAEANLPPQACLFVVQAERLEYGDGGSAPTFQTVPPSEYLPEEDSDDPRVRAHPGMRLHIDTQPPANLQLDACTLDPEGDELSFEWTLEKPEGSAARLTTIGGPRSEFEVDAAGSYTAAVKVVDSFGQSATAELEINALPQDDLFVQLSWPESSNAGAVADLDLHLVRQSADRLFCEDDCFFGNPNPSWGDMGESDRRPRLLRDDQGTGGRFESISLPRVIDSERFVVLVHYWSIEGVSQLAVYPKLLVRIRGEEQLFDFDLPLENEGDLWEALQIDFPPGGTPQILELSSLSQTQLTYEGDLLSCP